jgi:hypothetical protein
MSREPLADEWTGDSRKLCGHVGGLWTCVTLQVIKKLISGLGT